MAVKKGRVQIVVNKIKYDLTGKTHDLLTKGTFRLKFPTVYAEQKRADRLESLGLVKRTLATSKSVTYKRTELGLEVHKAIVERSKK